MKISFFLLFALFPILSVFGQLPYYEIMYRDTNFLIQETDEKGIPYDVWRFKDNLDKGFYQAVEISECGRDTILTATFIEDGIKDGTWKSYSDRLCTGFYGKDSTDIDWLFIGDAQLNRIKVYNKGVLRQEKSFLLDIKHPVREYIYNEEGNLTKEKYMGWTIYFNQTLELDQSTPTKTMELLFQAAKTGDFEILDKLCPPSAKMDGDVKCLCDLGPNTSLGCHEDLNEEDFISYFKKATLLKNEHYEVDIFDATIPFLFGKNGDKEETMHLIKEGGKWYLYSF